MPGFYQNPGTTWITNKTSVAIGPTGKAIRVFDAIYLSSGTATSVKLYNGTDATGSAFIQIDGTASKSANMPSSANGILFPSGCYVGLDNNSNSVAISWDAEQT